jgi:hypothetical protein
MMKETGIIMSGRHPVDILEGRKTMTRRIRGLKEINQHPDDWELVAVFQDGCAQFCTHDGSQELNVRCPYGGYGDLLWVKENLYRNPYFDEAGYVSDNSAVMFNETIGDMLKWRWKKDILPAMFMPREASRILLKIVEIRVERLQAITEEDAIKEGIEKLDYGWKPQSNHNKGKPWASPISAYADLWDSLNAKRGYRWEKNNWVWVIAFVRS